MKKVIVLALVVLSLSLMAGVAGATPNGSILPYALQTAR